LLNFLENLKIKISKEKFSDKDLDVIDIIEKVGGNKY
jgi:hypothetical protein